MRVPVLLLALSTTLPAFAAPPRAKAKSAPTEESLPPAKADAATAAKALLTHELPKVIDAPERTRLDAVVAELLADRLTGGVALYRAWASTKRLRPEDAAAVALWVFREGVLARNEELAAAVDRVRFFDERAAAVEDSLALVKGAMISRKPVLVARLVVLTPYSPEAHGDQKVERHLSRDAFDAEVRALEAKADEARAERDTTRAAFRALDSKFGPRMQVLAALLTAPHAGP